MSRLRMVMLLAGCCTLLTCQTGQPGGIHTSTSKPISAAAEGPALASAPVESPWNRDLRVRAITESGRVSPRLARLAVTRIKGGDRTVSLRLDRLLAGESGWLVELLADCGLEVRRQREYVLLDGDGPRSARAGLRKAITSIHAAIQRLRGNLLRQTDDGHRRVFGALENAVSQETLNAVPLDDRDVCVDFRQGPIEHTGAAFDWAIQGQGLFKLELAEGDKVMPAFTRHGRFSLDGDGAIVWGEAAGRAALLPRVSLPGDTLQVMIARDGTLTVRRTGQTATQKHRRVKLYWFDHPEHLRPIGDGLFVRTPGAGNLIEGFPSQGLLGELVQGAIEQSNVDPLESWAELCALEDGRQLVLAMISALDGGDDPAWPRQAMPARRVAHHSPRPAGAAVSIPLADPGFDAFEPALARFLRLRGASAVIGDSVVELERCPETAFTLASYLEFLRTRLDVIAQNIARATEAQGEGALSRPYRRRRVVLNGRGEAEVVEDSSPWRVVRAEDAAASSGGYVMRSNVEVDLEMADADAVSREYRAVREALQSMGTDAVAALTHLLRGSSETGSGNAVSRPTDVRLDAVWALGEIGPEAAGAVPALIEALKANDGALREGAAAALERIEPRSEVVIEAVVAMWLRGLDSGDVGRRYRAAVALGKLGPKAAAAVPALISRVTDPTSGAARALGGIGAAAAVPALADALAQENRLVREQAADALGRIGPSAQSAVPALVRAMQGEDPEVRWRCAVAIGRIGLNDSGCEAALAELLRDEDAYVRGRVAEALGRLGEPRWQIRAALARAVRAEQGRGPVRRSMIWAALSGRSPVFTLLSAAAMCRTDGASQGPARLILCRVVGHLGPLARPAVPMLLRMVEDEDGVLAAAAMETLGRLGPYASGAVPALSIALDSRSPLVRHRAAVALGAIGPPAAGAVPALIARLGDGSEQVILASVDALGRIGPRASDAVAPLRRLQDHNRVLVREAAWSSLARIVEFEGIEDAITSKRYRVLAETATDVDGL